MHEITCAHKAVLKLPIAKDTIFRSHDEINVNFSRCSSPRNEISWKSGHATGTGSDCATLYSEESPQPNSKPRYTYQDLLARKAMQLSDNLARHSMLQSMLEPTYPKKTLRQYYNARFHSHIRFS